MTDIRRTILWVVFAFSLIMLWDKWQIHNGNPATFFPAASPVTAQNSSTNGAENTANATPAATVNTAVDATGAAAEAAPVGETVVITTDVLRLTLSTEGGTVVRTELLNYKQDADRNQPVVLLDETPQHSYVAQTGLIGGNYPTHKTVMQLQPGERTLQDGQDSLTVRLESPEMDGVKLVKTLTFKRGAYDVAVQHDVINTGNQSINPQL